MEEPLGLKVGGISDQPGVRTVGCHQCDGRLAEVLVAQFHGGVAADVPDGSGWQTGEVGGLLPAYELVICQCPCGVEDERFGVEEEAGFLDAALVMVGQCLALTSEKIAVAEDNER